MNLIRKDYAAFGHIILFQFAATIALLSFGLFIDKKGTMTFVALVFYPLTIPTILLISDKKYVSLCNSIPISRSSYVWSKYIGGFLAAFFIILSGLAYGYLVTTHIVEDGVNFRQLFSVLGFSFIILPVILANSLVFPIYFKFSREKGSLVLIFIFIVILLALLIGVSYAERSLTVLGLTYTDQDVLPVLTHLLRTYVIGIGLKRFVFQLVASVMAFFAFSVALSLRWFGKKDIGGE